MKFTITTGTILVDNDANTIGDRVICLRISGPTGMMSVTQELSLEEAGELAGAIIAAMSSKKFHKTIEVE